MSQDPQQIQQVSLELARRSEGKFRAGAFQLILEVLGNGVSRGKFTRREQIPTREFVEELAAFAGKKYGIFAFGVLSAWGVKTTEDIGRVVHEMSRLHVLSLSPQDSLESICHLFPLKARLEGPYMAEPPYLDPPSLR